jgi:hypothetical protein
MIIDNYIGFLLVLTAESQEEFFKGYRLAKAGKHPGRTWKDVNKKTYTRNNYKKKRGTK